MLPAAIVCAGMAGFFVYEAVTEGRGDRLSYLVIGAVFLALASGAYVRSRRY
jgi:hypothetical protein